MADILERLKSHWTVYGKQSYLVHADDMRDAIAEIERLRSASVGADVGAGDAARVCEALGFDPTNHHNALKCPYCNPQGLVLAQPPAAVGAGVGAEPIWDTP
ncbi:hypothetical protein [Methylobacterium oryzisoli]|uniref:hypothetical protein n=1 Tax=Methylobacterium oryzisoli TaxID=3385502 RepID=UPI003891AFF8